ncbi:MAG: hypothetical protein AABN33_27135 [Acidobacteriota bacterium]
MIVETKARVTGRKAVKPDEGLKPHDRSGTIAVHCFGEAHRALIVSPGIG